MTLFSRGLVVMIGTALRGRGGMSSVVAAYAEAGLFDRVPVRYIEAHREVPVPGKIWLVASGLVQLLFLLLHGRVALLHVHAASGVSFWRKRLFIRLAQLFSRPVVIHLHGGEFIEFYRECPAHRQRLVRDTLESAERVVVLSAIWRERLREISEHLRIEVLPNPVALPAEAPAHAGGEFRILFLGRLERAKGIFELLPAFAQLRHVCADAVLTLGGEGDFAAVREQLARLGIEDCVEMPGWVVGDAKQSLLQRADAFVLPSHVEGLPISMLEAMAYGIPVVVSRVGAVPEVINDGEQGLLIDVGDIPGILAALVKLAASETERHRLGQAGRALIASTYATDRVCLQLEAIYADVVPEGEKPCCA